jgi:hypothetical protein
MKTIVEGMSLNKKEAEQKIGYLAKHLAEHMMKIFLYPETTHVAGWTKEVRAVYNRCQDLGLNLKKNKRLDHSSFFDNLYAPVAGSKFDALYEAVSQDFTGIVPAWKPDDKRVLDATMTAVYNQLANCLAQNKSWTQFVHTLYEAARLE